ncbi:pilus assembly protein PilM [Vibrio sp. PP-XX7]
MNKFMVTGIDIHHHRITAVTLMRQEQSFSFVSLKVFPTSADIFSENDVLNYQKIVKKLTEIRKGLPFFQRKVSIAIPDLAVISRIVHPEHQENQVMEAWGVYQAFAEMTSLPKEGLQFDYTPLTDGFQVYAAKREVVDSRLTALRLAKLQPILVDTEKAVFSSVFD